MMRPVHVSLRFACLMCAVMTTSAYGSDLLITAHVTKEEYCRSNGVDQVRLTVGFTYLNRGEQTLIMLLVTHLSEFQVQGEMGKPFQIRRKLHDLEGISPAIYTTPAPSPTLFYVLSRGQSREGMPQSVIFRLAPAGARAGHGVLTPGEYRVAFNLNLGSLLPGDPYVPPNRWSHVGTLVLGATPTEQLVVKVSEANGTPCSPPRLIM